LIKTKKVPRGDFSNSYGIELLFGQDFFHQVSSNNFFFEGVSTGLFRLHRTDHFSIALAVGFLEGRNYFLCHGYLISL
jgi:hypothetical protein